MFMFSVLRRRVERPELAGRHLVVVGDPVCGEAVGDGGPAPGGGGAEVRPSLLVHEEVPAVAVSALEDGGHDLKGALRLKEAIVVPS